MKLLCRISLLIVAFSLNFFGQNPKNITNPGEREELNTRTMDRDLENRIRNLRRLGNEPTRPEKSNESTAGVPKILPRKIINEGEISIRIYEINQKMSAPVEYKNRFAEFLKSKNTGIVRLFPDKNCGKGLVVDIRELERCAETPQVKGAGSLFSVRLKNTPNNLPPSTILHYLESSDIHFVENKFIVGNKTIQDIISDIGEVDLTDNIAKSDSLKFLTELKPSKTTEQLRAQNQIFEKGVKSNGYFYSSSVPVKLNSTYVLRSIAYHKRYQEFKNFWNTDLLLAFKVVGQEKDGSVIILWKKLKEKNAPVLKDK
jgi:hypothetical protein